MRRTTSCLQARGDRENDVNVGVARVIHIDDLNAAVDVVDQFAQNRARRLAHGVVRRFVLIDDWVVFGRGVAGTGRLFVRIPPPASGKSVSSGGGRVPSSSSV